MKITRETTTPISDAEFLRARESAPGPCAGETWKQHRDRVAKERRDASPRGKLLSAISRASYSDWRATVTDIAIAGDKPIPNLGHRVKSFDEALAALVKLPEAARFLHFLACHRIDDKAMSRVCCLLAVFEAALSVVPTAWVHLEPASRHRRNGLPGYNPIVAAFGVGDLIWLSDFADCLTPEAAAQRLARIRDGTFQRNAPLL